MSTYLKYFNHHVIFHSANVAYIEPLHIIFKELWDIVKSDQFHINFNIYIQYIQ